MNKKAIILFSFLAVIMVLIFINLLYMKLTITMVKSNRNKNDGTILKNDKLKNSEDTKEIVSFLKYTNTEESVNNTGSTSPDRNLQKNDYMNGGMDSADTLHNPTTYGNDNITSVNDDKDHSISVPHEGPPYNKETYGESVSRTTTVNSTDSLGYLKFIEENAVAVDSENKTISHDINNDNTSAPTSKNQPIHVTPNPPHRFNYTHSNVSSTIDNYPNSSRDILTVREQYYEIKDIHGHKHDDHVEKNHHRKHDKLDAEHAHNLHHEDRSKGNYHTLHDENIIKHGLNRNDHSFKFKEPHLNKHHDSIHSDKVNETKTSESDTSDRYPSNHKDPEDENNKHEGIINATTVIKNETSTTTRTDISKYNNSIICR